MAAHDLDGRNHREAIDQQFAALPIRLHKRSPAWQAARRRAEESWPRTPAGTELKRVIIYIAGMLAGFGTRTNSSSRKRPHQEFHLLAAAP